MSKRSSKTPSESKIETDHADWLKKRGGLSIKLDVKSRVGVPDRLIVLPGGRIFFIEFKKLGEAPDPIQWDFHKRLARRGATVYTCDSLEEAQRVTGLEEQL